MSERGKSGIYSITHVASGTRYIGQAASIGDRWLTHRSHLDLGRHHCRHLQSAWKKYGAGAFAFFVLEYVPLDKEALASREQHWFDKLRPEYNVAPAAGSSLGVKHPPRSEEFRLRMGEMKRGFRHSPETIALLKRQAAERAYRHPEEVRARISAALTGRARSAEAIEKHRAAVTGRKQTPEEIARRSASLTGKKRTPEQCARIAEAKKGHGAGVKRGPRPPHVIEAMRAGRQRWLEAKRGV